MSDSNRVQLGYVQETTFGAVKSGANLKIIRMTGESLAKEAKTAVSNELRSDRQVADLKRTGINAAGGVNMELSYSSYDDLIQAALGASAWAAAVTVGPLTTISASSTDNSFSDSANGFGGLSVGQWIKVSGFAAPATGNNGYFKIVTKAADKITVSHGTVTTKAAGDSVTVKQGAYAENGTTALSFNIEKNFLDVAKIQLFTGMMVNGMNLSIPVDNIVTGSFDFLGKDGNFVTATAGTGYDAAPTTDVMSSIDDVKALFENGTAYDATNFTLALSNAMAGRNVIGTLGLKSIRVGALALTGTLQAYFEDAAVVAKFESATPSTLAIRFTDYAGNTYVLELPKVKYSSGKVVACGKDGDCVADMAWTALMHATELKTIRLVRFPAA